MTTSMQREVTAWGRSSRTRARVWPVVDAAAVRNALAAAGPRGSIARGYGRSYGDQCLNEAGEVLDLTAMRDVHAFDADTGALTCAAGVSFADLTRDFLPRGWLPATCPGTAFVSMGGAIANDVHGKNQHVAGSFGDHVEWFDLLRPDGEVQRVTATSDPALFAATVGGIGLTGVVLALRMRMQRVPSNAMLVREARVPDLDTFLAELTDNEERYPYIVGWIDALARGGSMGRGVIELARHDPQSVRSPGPLRIPVPFDFPPWVLNSWSVGAFNAVYYRRIPRAGRERRMHAGRFLYPLDALTNWNRMYGRPGVLQFQCAVPRDGGRRALVELLEATVRSQGASFLAVLKSMARSGAGMLGFPMPGFTLALDFPRRQATVELVQRLQAITARHGGRVYLAKDACLDAATLRAMYPRAGEFEAVLRGLDPGVAMQSDMSRRLGLAAARA